MATVPQAERGDVLMEWTFPEFVKHDRQRSWYLWFLAILVGSVVYGIWSVSYTFVAVIVLAAFVIIARHRRPPLDVRFAIREEGIEIGQNFYVWREIKEFWMLYQPPKIKKLYFDFKRNWQPSLDIDLQSQNPLQLRQLLSEHLVENVHREAEPAPDQWSRVLKI